MPPGTSVLVGLSGGADSMALLHWLIHCPERQWTVSAVHIHHGIRGEEADADERFVRKQCNAWGVPLTVLREDVPALAAAAHRGLEETGRQVRYEAFERERERCGAAVIATAHTASDRAETVLMHLVRGCGIGGLAGIPPRRGHIVRPLLTCTREDVERYCALHAIPFVQDSTNRDMTYTRNAMRLRALPMLEEIAPAATKALLRMADAAAADDACLCDIARQALDAAACGENRYRRDVFSAQPRPIAVRMLRLALERVDCRSMEERHADLLLAQIAGDGGAVSLPEGFAVKVNDCTVEVLPETAVLLLQEALAVVPPCRFSFANQQIFLNVVTKEQNVHKLFSKYVIDYDKIQSGLIVRCRQSGDRLHPAGRGVGKTLKELLAEASVPTGRRAAFPVLCDADGIVLVPGITCDERVRTDEHTKHFLVWITENEPR